MGTCVDTCSIYIGCPLRHELVPIVQVVCIIVDCPLRGHRGDTSHAGWSLLSSLSVYIQVVLCVVTVGTQAMQLVSIVQAVCCWSLRGHHAARAM